MALAPVIRALRPEDADTLGAVHVRAWQTAYRGLMPDGDLAKLTVADRAATWARALAGGPRPRSARFGAERHGRVVGFSYIVALGTSGSSPPAPHACP